MKERSRNAKDPTGPDEKGPAPRTPEATYAASFAELREAFTAGRTAGRQMIAARADAADALVSALWAEELRSSPALASGTAVLAVGGYGRRELFPLSDLDLLFLLRDSSLEKEAKELIRTVSRRLWDTGIRVAATTRTVAECARLREENPEFTLALLDLRPVCGDAELAESLRAITLPSLIRKDRRALGQSLLEMTRERHARYGNTLFHLEPNVKDSPGGVRDANVCGWLALLFGTDAAPALPEFERAFDFLASVRCFLHLRAGRDNSVLDWKAQDEAARLGIGLPRGQSRDAAGWMQMYFRHARVIARRVEQLGETVPAPKPLLRMPPALRRRTPGGNGAVLLENGRVSLRAGAGEALPADAVLDVFEVVSSTGARPSLALENAIENALPELSAQLDEGAALWSRFGRILTGPYAGVALRSMHTLGVLEMIVPEFHGIDALVIRDAYHRYTVDEHTFLLIDSLHNLRLPGQTPTDEWQRRFGNILDELDRPDLLYLAALLHDTGKGRSTGEHTTESVRLAESVAERLELDSYESGLVLSIIRQHLEMSAALRRDIFDSATVSGFAHRVETPEALRMLTLFTYADIKAVNPDALTPWKAENLWRLYIATSNFLDRSIDDERVDSRISSELLQNVTSLVPRETPEVLRFLEGFPQRYLRTRSPEHIQAHFRMSRQLGSSPIQLELRSGAESNEITLVTPDRKLLFASVAGVLSGWGMNIVSADAFSNAAGIVVDTFRFTDGYKTLERNPGERERLLADVRGALESEAAATRIITGRRRRRRRDPLLTVETSLTFDAGAAAHPGAAPHVTVLQVVAQDHPGLLYAISKTLGEAQCNIEVAVIDTEGDTAIDVFYLRRNGEGLEPDVIAHLREALAAAIAENAK